GFRLDVVVAASGFGGKEMKILDEYIASRLEEEDGSESEGSDTESEDEGDSGDESHTFRQVRPAAQDCTTRQERRGILEQPLSEDEGGDVRPPSPVSALPMGSMRIQEGTGDSGAGDKVASLEDDQRPQHGDTQDEVGASDGGGREDHNRSKSIVRDLVASTLDQERRRNAKHHSKRGTTKVGRTKGHKGKMNARLKADSSGVWD
ncbi:hypothetical protein FRC06_005908, partial [Ceratobasidium sp. 370]